MKAKIVKVDGVDQKLGLVFAKAIVCTIDGEPYYDLGSLDDDGNAYADHVSPEEMTKAVTDFMQSARITDVMHDEQPDGVVVHSMPWTADVAKAFGEPAPKVEAWLVAFKPDATTFAKFVSGEFTGVSIGGTAYREKES